MAGVREERRVACLAEAPFAVGAQTRRQVRCAHARADVLRLMEDVRMWRIALRGEIRWRAGAGLRMQLRRMPGTERSARRRENSGGRDIDREVVDSRRRRGRDDGGARVRVLMRVHSLATARFELSGWGWWRRPIGWQP